MAIDTNVYWFDENIFKDKDLAERFLSEMPEYYDMHGYMQETPSGLKQIVIEKPTGYQNLNYIQNDYILETMLADMDQSGIEKSILKLPGCHEWMSLDMCKRFNDGMYQYAKESHGRLVPLAVVPPYASQAVFDELDRCFNELGMKGIQMCAHYGDKYLDSEIFAEFFKKLNEREVPVYVHHTPVPVEYNSLYDYNNLRRSYGRCVDQTTAICRELFSGFFDKYPNLTFVHSFLGGGFFAIATMLFPKQSKSNEAVQRFETNQTNVFEQFKKHIYFETSHAQPWGVDCLECAVKVLGADHIIYGSSYPVRKEWMTGGVDFIEKLNISDADKQLILCDNAKRIYKID